MRTFDFREQFGVASAALDGSRLTVNTGEVKPPFVKKQVA